MSIADNKEPLLIFALSALFSDELTREQGGEKN